MKRIIIDDDIFDSYPEFYRGIIVVEGITNHISLKRVRKLLNQAITTQASADLASDECITAWDLAHRKFGSNPDKFPPSIKSLIKRVQKSPKMLTKRCQ